MSSQTSSVIYSSLCLLISCVLSFHFRPSPTTRNGKLSRHQADGRHVRRSHFQISELETAEKLSVDRESIKDSFPPMRRAGEDGGTVTRDGACAPVNQDESAVDVSFIDFSVATFAHRSNVDASVVVDIWLAQRTQHVSCGIETSAKTKTLLLTFALLLF